MQHSPQPGDTQKLPASQDLFSQQQQQQQQDNTTSPPGFSSRNAGAAQLQVQQNTASCLEMLAATPKLPAYLPNDVELWFINVEQEFKNKRITQNDTKFGQCLTAIPPEAQGSIKRVIVNNRNDADSYLKLKNALIRVNKLTDQQRMEKFKALSLGEKGAVILVNEMLNIYNKEPDADDWWFRSSFIEKMPKVIRAALWDTPKTADYEALAEKADRLISGITDQERAHILLAQQQAASESNQDVEVLAASARGRGRGAPFSTRGSFNAPSTRGARGGATGRGASAAPGSSSTGQSRRNWCWYHWRFGPEAQKCPGRPDCNFRASGNAPSGN